MVQLVVLVLLEACLILTTGDDQALLELAMTAMTRMIATNDSAGSLSSQQGSTSGTGEKTAHSWDPLCT